MLQKCWAVCSRALVGQLSCMQISASTSYNQIRTVRSHKFSPWWIKPKHPFVQEHVTPANQAFMEDITAEIYKQKAENSPLKSEPWEREKWTPKFYIIRSVRTGLIAKKIGYFPQWDKNGKLLVCTLLQVQDNHVLSYTDPITWYKYSRIGKKEGQKRLGRLTVGVNATSPRQYVAAYRGLFEKSGVMPKDRLASFAITTNAKIQPGTRLYATHFRVGQYVDLWGRTIDRGFQGVMKRWGFAGGPAVHGTTKAHRRPGSIGHREDRHVRVGRKMAGQMGNVWRPLRGVKIIRINTKYQVLYVHARGVMGNIGNYIYVKDSGLIHRRVENPPFPTHYPEEETKPLPEEYFDDKLFQFTQPTIMFEDKDEPKLATGVKVKKQAKAQVKKT